MLDLHDTSAPTHRASELSGVDGLLVALDEQCALGCGFCLRADVGKQALALDLFSRALSRCKELGATSVCLTGGEPTDHPRFVDFVKVAVQFGYACSVVTAARAGGRLDTLVTAAGLLSHVTVSADSAGARAVGHTQRTISGTAAVFEELGRRSASLHVTVWDVTVDDIEGLAGVLAAHDVALELSPLVPSDGMLRRLGRTRIHEQHRLDIERISAHLPITDGLRAAGTQLGTVIGEYAAPTCTSTRLYLSPGGTLRVCPYDKQRELPVTESRATIQRWLDTVQQAPSVVGQRCALVCGRAE